MRIGDRPNANRDVWQTSSTEKRNVKQYESSTHFFLGPFVSQTTETALTILAGSQPIAEPPVRIVAIRKLRSTRRRIRWKQVIHAHCLIHLNDR